MKRIVLINRNDIRKEESQKQYEFVRYVLQEMELPEEELNECFPEDDLAESFTVEQKIKLRALAKKFDIKIISDGDGGTDIYVGNELVAQWHKCFFVLKEDRSAIDPKERIYAEMHMNFWIFQKD